MTLGEHIAPQSEAIRAILLESEVIRAILLEDSPRAVAGWARTGVASAQWSEECRTPPG